MRLLSHHTPAVSTSTTSSAAKPSWMSTPVEKMRRRRTGSPSPRPTARKRLIAADTEVVRKVNTVTTPPTAL